MVSINTWLSAEADSHVLFKKLFYFAIMKKPISFRMQIPFFIEKSEIDFQKDLYERFDDMVVRHIALHLTDDLWGGYPFQKGFDFARKHLQNERNLGKGKPGW